jgi:hypothetical protein
MSQVVQLQSIQRMICTGCGAEANASCNCGKPYVPKAQRAKEAIEAKPHLSNVAIAKDIGVDEKTVRKARATSDQSEVDEKRTGRDGKVRRMPIRESQDKAMPTEAEAEESYQETLYDQACLLLESMADATRQRFFAFLERKYNERA